MQNPFITLWHTITDIKIYRRLVSESPASGLRYFGVCYGFISIIFGVIIAITVIPDLTNQLNSVVQSIATHYPSPATLTFQNGTLAVTGALEPVSIPLPAPVPNVSSRNFLVINTATPAADVTSLSTLFLASKKSLAVVTDTQTHEYQLVDWPNFPDPLVITAADLKQNFASLQSTAAAVNSFRFLVIPLAVFCISVISRLLYIVAYTCLTTVVGMIFGRPYRYRHLFNIGLYTVVLADLINFLAGLLYTNQTSSLFSLAFIGINTIVLLSLPKKP